MITYFFDIQFRTILCLNVKYEFKEMMQLAFNKPLRLWSNNSPASKVLYSTSSLQNNFLNLFASPENSI